jgi:hypothetical protein
MYYTDIDRGEYCYLVRRHDSTFDMPYRKPLMILEDLPLGFLSVSTNILHGTEKVKTS